MYDGFYREPPIYDNQRKAASLLRGDYPFLKVFPIGKSVLGRSIYALGFGGLYGGTVFLGGVHGMEWLTTLLLYRFCEDICISLREGQPLAEVDLNRSLENRSVTFIPCLNPDGVEISLQGAAAAGNLSSFVEKACQGDTTHWQANARGVDLNHNFDAGFAQARELEREAGVLCPGPTRYGGERPNSEPETRSIVQYCQAFGVRQAYAFHSQGEEIYYQYGSHTPARSQLMAQVLASASGYRLAEPDPVAAHGGFKDWFIEKTHRPGFTIEIGRGKNPLPVQELGPIYGRLLEMLLIAVLL